MFSLSGAASAAEAQPECDVGDHQPGGGGGLQVEGGGQGGRRGVGQGEGRHEQQWQWQWRRGRWQVHRSWFVLLSTFHLLLFIVICRWFRGEQGEPGRAAHPKFHADLGEEEQEEEQPVHPLRQGQGEVRGEETWRGSCHQVSLSHPLIMRCVKVCRDLRNVRGVSCVVIR